MNKLTIFVIIVVILIGGVAYWKRTGGPIANPDPNHTHADFAVWVSTTKLDFSGESYMSGNSTDADHDNETGNRKYLHLHDGNGDVVHRHKPGLTLADFFETIGFTASDGCLAIDDVQYARLDAGWKSDFAVTKNLCDNGKFRWTMVVNGQVRPFDLSYAFADEDKILLSYGSSDTAWQQQMNQLSDDACKYSKTCPWKGEPPTENCVADPAVPCVVQ